MYILGDSEFFLGDLENLFDDWECFFDDSVCSIVASIPFPVILRTVFGDLEIFGLFLVIRKCFFDVRNISVSLNAKHYCTHKVMCSPGIFPRIE